MGQISNPYLAVVLVPLVIFLILIFYRVDPDTINLWSRAYVFSMLGYVGARYVGRAPVLMWERNTSPEARNIVGFAIFLVGLALQVAYGWIYISYQRPLWLSSQYWGASFVVLLGVGLSLVASSVPKFPPFGDGKNGLGEVASVLVVLLSALTVFFVSHIPAVVAGLKALFAPLLHAL